MDLNWTNENDLNWGYHQAQDYHAKAKRNESRKFESETKKSDISPELCLELDSDTPN